MILFNFLHQFLMAILFGLSMKVGFCFYVLTVKYWYGLKYFDQVKIELFLLRIIENCIFLNLNDKVKDLHFCFYNC